MNRYEERMLEVQREEDQIQFSTFSHAMALRVGVRLAEVATEAGQAVTIDIMRGEQQLFHHALEGTSADNDAWIQRKNRVVRRFGHSSFYMGLYYRSRDTTLEEKIAARSAQVRAARRSLPALHQRSRSRRHRHRVRPPTGGRPQTCRSRPERVL